MTTAQKTCIKILFFLFLLVPSGRIFALSVSPSKLEISGDAGTQIKADMILLNDKDENQTFYSSYANFEAQGESGTPSFVRPHEDLAVWMRVPDTLTLAPFETKTIPLVITIPKDADPGGHFATVFWSTQPVADSEHAQLSISGSLGILVLLRVNGDVTEGGTILSFGTKDSIKKYDALPVNFVYRFNNTGDDRVKPAGTIVIKNILGMTAATLDGNLNQGNVLPHSIRKFESIWAKNNTDPAVVETVSGFFDKVSYEWHNFAFGRYTANLSLVYSTKNLSDSASTTFFVFPWQLLIVIVVILLLLYIVLRKMLRAYNRMLIAQVRMKIEEEIEEKHDHEEEKPVQTHRPRPRV